MHHGDYNDEASLNAVEHTEGKTPCQRATCIAMDDG